MSGALAQENVPGGLWPTNAQGIASPQAGRPALTGGLQQMQMLHAFRQGAGMQQLQAMNPYTPRPTQFLPQALPNFDYAAQFRQQQDAARAQALAAQRGMGGYVEGGDPGGADGPGDGSGAAAASAAAGDSLGGSVGEAIGDAVGGGGDGGGGSK